MYNLKSSFHISPTSNPHFHGTNRSFASYRVQIIVWYSLCKNFPSTARVSVLQAEIVLGIAKQLRHLQYIICVFAKLFTAFNWEKKLNLIWEYQALKPALFPHANTQCPDK